MKGGKREGKAGYSEAAQVDEIAFAQDRGMGGYVYIVTNRRYGTLYIGVTSDLVRRISQHRLGVVEGFTKEFVLKRLVWYEIHSEILEAIVREKQLKKWRRDWKIELIQKMNPRWEYLYPSIL